MLHCLQDLSKRAKAHIFTVKGKQRTIELISVHYIRPLRIWNVCSRGLLSTPVSGVGLSAALARVCLDPVAFLRCPLESRAGKSADLALKFAAERRLDCFLLNMSSDRKSTRLNSSH